MTATMIADPAAEAYEYNRYTLPGRQRELSVQEDLEMAERIVADEVFCGQLYPQVVNALKSGDKDRIWQALQDVYRFEDLIRHSGGWKSFLKVKAAKVAAEAKEKAAQIEAARIADGDPIAIDEANRRASGSKLPAPAPLAQLIGNRDNAELLARSTELLELEIEWPNKVRRLLRSKKSAELADGVKRAEAFLAEAEEQAAREADPLSFLQPEADKLQIQLRSQFSALKGNGTELHKELITMIGEVQYAWNDLDRLQEVVDEIKLFLNPPTEAEEPRMILPPVEPCATTDFAHEFRYGVDDRSRTEGVTRSGGSNSSTRKRKPSGKKGK